MSASPRSRRLGRPGTARVLVVYLSVVGNGLGVQGLAGGQALDARGESPQAATAPVRTARPS